jgi:hypothetical protein
MVLERKARMPIVKCTCKKEKGQGATWQDEKYGPGLRVANLRKDGKSARCVVCGTEHNVASKEEK